MFSAPRRMSIDFPRAFSYSSAMDSEHQASQDGLKVMNRFRKKLLHAKPKGISYDYIMSGVRFALPKSCTPPGVVTFAYVEHKLEVKHSMAVSSGYDYDCSLSLGYSGKGSLLLFPLARGMTPDIGLDVWLQMLLSHAEDVAVVNKEKLQYINRTVTGVMVAATDAGLAPVSIYPTSPLELKSLSHAGVSFGKSAFYMLGVPIMTIPKMTATVISAIDLAVKTSVHIDPSSPKNVSDFLESLKPSPDLVVEAAFCKDADLDTPKETLSAEIEIDIS